MTLKDYIIWQIFSSRRNFGELPKQPRQDMTLAEWLMNGPSWLYLPYTKFSPTELAVFIKHFHVKPALQQIPKTLGKSITGTMWSRASQPFPANPGSLAGKTLKNMILKGGWYSLKAYYALFQQLQDANTQARNFRTDLSSDPWIKNSYRHAYWMCIYARKWSSEFAADLGYAHEYAHLDLTIEGPFDSLIDKINNFQGVKLAHQIESECDLLVNKLGDSGYLAWAKEYKKNEDNGIYLPTLYNIKAPLDNLWLEFQALPEFNEYDLKALRLLRIELPGRESTSTKIEEIE